MESVLSTGSTESSSNWSNANRRRLASTLATATAVIVEHNVASTVGRKIEPAFAESMLARIAMTPSGITATPDVLIARNSAIESVVNGTFKGGVQIPGPGNGGIAISREQDLADFIDFGINAGAISEGDRGGITKNWLAMRSAIPGWIWDAVGELEAKINSGEAEIPCGWCADTIDDIRAKYPD